MSSFIFPSVKQTIIKFIFNENKRIIFTFLGNILIFLQFLANIFSFFLAKERNSFFRESRNESKQNGACKTETTVYRLWKLTRNPGNLVAYIQFNTCFE